MVEVILSAPTVTTYRIRIILDRKMALIAAPNYRSYQWCFALAESGKRKERRMRSQLFENKLASCNSAENPCLRLNPRQVTRGRGVWPVWPHHHRSIVLGVEAANKRGRTKTLWRRRLGTLALTLSYSGLLNGQQTNVVWLHLDAHYIHRNLV